MTRLKLDYTDISTNLEGREIDFFEKLKLSIKRQVLSHLIFHHFRITKYLWKECYKKKGGGVALILWDIIYTAYFSYLKTRIRLIWMYVTGWVKKKWFVSIMELSPCHKLKFSSIYIFAPWWCKPVIFETLII